MAINTVADGYVELIKIGKRTMKQVPSGLKAEVQAKIDALLQEQQPVNPPQ